MTESRPSYQTNRKGDINQSLPYDRCQSPGYALDPVLPYLPQDWVIWESACGGGNLMRRLLNEGYNVIGTDVLSGKNFFHWEPQTQYDAQITNPPYSVKYEWLKRSYELGKPFALLMPVETMAAGRAIHLFVKHGIEIIVPNRRIDFEMPNKGVKGTATYPTMWFTWGLNIGTPLTFTSLVKRPDSQLMIPDLAGVTQ